MRRYKFKSVIMMPVLVLMIAVGWLVLTTVQSYMYFDIMPDDKNLLSNPGFEMWSNENMVREWEIKNAMSVKKVKGFNSTTGMRVDSSNEKITTIDSSVIMAQPNQSYFFKTFYQTNTELSLVAQLIYQDDSTEYQLVNYLPDYDYPWSTMSGEVRTSEKVKAISWRIVMPSQGFIELDSAYVITTDKPTNQNPISENLILDYGTRLETAESKLEAGVSDYHFRVSNYENGQAEWFLTNVRVLPNELYRFNFSYQASVLNEIVIEVELNDGSYTYYEISENQPIDFWLKKSVEIETPNNAKSMAIFIRLNKDGDFDIKPNYTLHKLNNSARFNEPRVSITFDDGWLSSYLNGAAILEKYGMRGTFYIVPNLIEQKNHIKEEQMEDLINRGHEIGSHTFNHQDLSMLRVEELANELTRANQYLEQKLKLTQIDFASPYGKIDLRGLELTKKIQRSHRGTRAGINTKQNLGTHDLYVLFMDKGKSSSDLLKKINQVKAFNGWLILVYHQVEPNESFFAIKEDVFREQVKLISESGVRVETVGEVLRAIETERQ